MEFRNAGTTNIIKPAYAGILKLIVPAALQQLLKIFDSASAINLIIRSLPYLTDWISEAPLTDLTIKPLPDQPDGQESNLNYCDFN
jgi:hypothetical protein